MRQFFFLSVLIVGIVATVIYFLWSIVANLYHNWSLGRGVHQLEAESRSRRQQREQEASDRLNNGCEHAFGTSFGGFPDNACPRCGLEATKPAGPCDHVWRLAHEPIPCSFCEKCGKRYVRPAIRELS